MDGPCLAIYWYVYITYMAMKAKRHYIFTYCIVHMFNHTHARTHARTHAHTHTQTHTQTLYSILLNIELHTLQYIRKYIVACLSIYEKCQFFIYYSILLNYIILFNYVLFCIILIQMKSFNMLIIDIQNKEISLHTGMLFYENSAQGL